MLLDVKLGIDRVNKIESGQTMADRTIFLMYGWP